MANREHTGNTGSGATLCRRWSVILAGGDGSRLLGLTRQIAGDERPKQFCRVLGRETLLEQTRSRVSRMFSPRHTLVVLTKSHEPFYDGQVNSIPRPCLLVQPSNRGTAAAILYSLARVWSLDPAGLVAFFPSDHYFSDESALAAHVESALREAESNDDRVILMGIVPDSPEVEYGWIQPGDPLGFTRGIWRVSRFWEKPSQELACSLMALGCLWNSFIMVGRVTAFLALTWQALPALFQSCFDTMSSDLCATDGDSLEALYSAIPPVNFSQTVLCACPERLAVLRADGLGWSDLGDPGRVLSIVARKGIHTEWEMDRRAGARKPLALGAGA